MEITIKFTNETARRNEYFLRRRYKSKAKLDKLAKVAILREVAQEAQKDIEPEFKEARPVRKLASVVAQRQLLKAKRLGTYKEKKR